MISNAGSRNGVRSVSIFQRPLGVEHATVVLVLILVEIVAEDGEEVLVVQVRPAVSRSQHSASAGFRESALGHRT